MQPSEGSAGNAVQLSTPVHISAIRAMPYYPTTGKIRQTTDLFDPRLALRNVVILPPNGKDPIRRANVEDWDIEFGTTVTYIRVELAASDRHQDAVDSALGVELQVRAVGSGRMVHRQRVRLATIGSLRESNLQVPFFIYGTGCEKLEIAVRLLKGEQVYESQKRVIPFTCGE
jgi:hypothetical protein